MTDSPLLRLARIVRDHVGADTWTTRDTVLEVAQLVRDLEAAPDPNVLPARSPARTITRAQFHAALSAIELEEGTSRAWHHDAVRAIAAAWGLTVEDTP